MYAFYLLQCQDIYYSCYLGLQQTIYDAFLYKVKSFLHNVISSNKAAYVPIKSSMRNILF